VLDEKSDGVWVPFFYAPSNPICDWIICSSNKQYVSVTGHVSLVTVDFEDPACTASTFLLYLKPSTLHPPLNISLLTLQCAMLTVLWH